MSAKKPRRAPKCAAVIFARGTGDAVPFLSARLLAGKPLLHHTIAAVGAAKKVSAVFVSTEDERVAAAARAAGVRVLMRPDELSRHETPLHSAVDHAARALRKLDPSVEAVVGVPGDAVFVEAPAIDAAVEALADRSHDRVIAVVPEFKKYVIWKTARAGSLDLIVAPPHLREKNERHYSEPGVITAWRILKDGGIAMDSARVGRVEIREEAAFRVDTEHDIFVAERILAPKRLALRCDGSPKMGMGHVMRLLNIAQKLCEAEGGWQTRVFVGSDHLEGAKILAERGLDVEVVRSSDVGHWLERIEAYGPRLVIADLPFVPGAFSEGLCDLPAETITLVDSVADLDPKTARLDTVISLLKEPMPYPCRRYHAGPNFAALHDSVTERISQAGKKRVFKPGKLKLLLAFGTQDPSRLTAKTLKFLSKDSSSVSGLTLVLKKEHQDAEFKKLIGAFPFKPKIVTSPSDKLGELLEACDAAVVSGGITAYEASSLGVPSVVLAQNDREFKRMQHFERSGSILFLGDGAQVTEAQFLRTLSRLCKDSALRKKLSQFGLKTSDGRGLERIAGVVGGLLNKAAAK